MMCWKLLWFYYLFFLFILVLMLSSLYWFIWVFSVVFEDSVLVFNIFLLILVSWMFFLCIVFIGLDVNCVVFYFLLVELFLNVVLGFWLVVFFGFLGVAWVIVIVYIVDKLLFCFYLYYCFGIVLVVYILVGWWGSYILLLAIGYVLIF